MERLVNYIDGAMVPSASSATTEVVDPATGMAYALAPASNAEDVDRAMAAAAKAFGTWKRTTPSERQLLLLKIADAFEEAKKDLKVNPMIRFRENHSNRQDVQLYKDVRIPPWAFNSVPWYSNNISAKEMIGLSVHMYWDGEDEFFRGVVTEYDPTTNRHKIVYDDGDEEVEDRKGGY